MLIGNNFRLKEDLITIYNEIIPKGEIVYCNGVGYESFNLTDENKNYVLEYKEAKKLERI